MQNLLSILIRIKKCYQHLGFRGAILKRVFFLSIQRTSAAKSEWVFCLLLSRQEAASLKLGVSVGYFNSFVLSYTYWPMVVSLLFSFIKSMQVCGHCDVTHSEDIEIEKKVVQTCPN